MTLTLATTADGGIVTGCHGVHPWGRSPFVPPHRTLPAVGERADVTVPLRNGWRSVSTAAELAALRAWGPWAVLTCFLCNRSVTL